ncbi:MAG: hypothetical protein OXF79_22915 [Chloroflexi bacterium]|nr:hypothetical protein [Chloroflexota bacterium]
MGDDPGGDGSGRIEGRHGVIYETLEETFEQLDAAVRTSDVVQEIVADKGYHCNLGLLMRAQVGVGTPRSLQGRAFAALDALNALPEGIWLRLAELYRHLLAQWQPNHIPFSIRRPIRLIVRSNSPRLT